MSSTSAGFVSAVLGTPADVIKTRMMNQPLNEVGKGIYYRGSIDCLTQAVKNEGNVVTCSQIIDPFRYRLEIV